jgi:hypothetical protein
MAVSNRQPSGWAVGWTWFAGFMMIMIGSWHAIAGLAAIINDTFYVKGADYVFQFDATTWGWIHLVAGILILFAGFGIFSGAIWARTVGVILAVISSILAFAWLPWYPVWGIAMVAVDVAVIWALTAHGRDVVDI